MIQEEVIQPGVTDYEVRHCNLAVVIFLQTLAIFHAYVTGHPLLIATCHTSEEASSSCSPAAPRCPPSTPGFFVSFPNPVFWAPKDESSSFPVSVHCMFWASRALIAWQLLGTALLPGEILCTCDKRARRGGRTNTIIPWLILTRGNGSSFFLRNVILTAGQRQKVVKPLKSYDKLY